VPSAACKERGLKRGVPLSLNRPFFVKIGFLYLMEDSSSSEKIKVIFLDVDGVLVPISSNHQIKTSAMEALQFITRESKARIVLSSTWRHSQRSITQLNTIFGEHGFGPIYSVTPHLWRGTNSFVFCDLQSVEWKR
jgi:hypothetical protein